MQIFFYSLILYNADTWPAQSRMFVSFSPKMNGDYECDYDIKINREKAE